MRPYRKIDAMALSVIWRSPAFGHVASDTSGRMPDDAWEEEGTTYAVFETRSRLRQVIVFAVSPDHELLAARGVDADGRITDLMTVASPRP